MMTSFRRLILPLLALGLAGAASVPAQAQNAIATVNGVPITNFDVAQRIRIVQLIEGRRMDQRTATQELIDDKVKLLEARRVGYRVTEDGVEVEYTRLAKSGGRDIKTFDAALRQAGVEPANLRDKIRADLAWQVLLRDQARKGSQVSSEELEKAIDEEMKKQKPVVDYYLRNVVFVVPRGVSPGARESAANAARARFSGCETGFDELRNLPEVAIRPAQLRSSDQLGEALVKLLDPHARGQALPAVPYRAGYRDGRGLRAQSASGFAGFAQRGGRKARRAPHHRSRAQLPRGTAQEGGHPDDALMAAFEDGLPPLREVIRTHGLEALKSLGQNFLLDFNITAKIAREAGPLEGRRVIEVGPAQVVSRARFSLLARLKWW